jgi:NAD(P)H dehydrogenase (quinone)
MASKRMLILYYSGSGHTERMANEIADGARSKKTDVEIKKVEEFEPSRLPDYDCLVFGTPTYFSNVAWQVKKLIDESIVYYRGKQLKGKVAGIFTSCGTRSNGQDCLKALEVALGHHHGMRVLEGVIRVDGESEEEVETKCRESGKRLSREIERG